MFWSENQVKEFIERYGIKHGVCLYKGAEDYHFPEKSFLTDGYTPPGGYVKDFSVIEKDGRLHLFHIDGRPGEVCWVTGNEISFGHASTSDFCHWIRHKMPLAVGERSWESEHVWAPFVYRKDDLYYMFYMGHGNDETFMSYATSADLEKWERWKDGPIRCAVGRDPFVYDCDGQTVLLYTGHGGARISACRSEDMVNWEMLPDLIDIPGRIAAESCSLHSLNVQHVLWWNDYRDQIKDFRAVYALSDVPDKFDPDAVKEFKFITDNPDAIPSPELNSSHHVPLSIELIAKSKTRWLVCYFRWQIDRNRLFFGTLDWSSDPAVIKEINDEDELNTILLEIKENPASN